MKGMKRKFFLKRMWNFVVVMLIPALLLVAVTTYMTLVTQMHRMTQDNERGIEAVRSNISLVLDSVLAQNSYMTGMQTIQALQNFTSAFVITDGGPMKATYVLGMKLYKEGFSYFKMGYASAISWIIFIVIMLITLVLFATSKRWVFYGDES